MNIGTLLTKSARTFGGKPAIRYGNSTRTYERFNSRVNALANAFCHLGLRQGDNVALLQYNYPQTLECLFSCFKCGLGAVPINWRLHPKEFSYIINDSDAKALILSPEFNHSISEIRKWLPKVSRFITLSGSEGGLLDYERLLLEEETHFCDREVHPDDVAWVFYTSGTTGLPKGAMLTHRNLLSMTLAFYSNVCPSFGNNEVMLHAAPLSHGSGLYSIPNIGKAALNIIFESKSFDPYLVMKTIQDYKVTNTFMAPTMIKLLLDSPCIDRFDSSSLKALCYGGAPILLEDLKRAIGKFKSCLVQLFGQGESPMTISYLPQSDHVLTGDERQMKRLRSAGYAHVNVEIRIVDPDGKELPYGRIGEIVTRSDLVMKGYWKNKDATSRAVKEGWLYTGDLGYMDNDGYVFILDRSKDMIITGGENVYPREIEEVLASHPAVREVAVFGIPDAKWGEAIKSVVALVQGASATEDELITFCKGQMASFKKPKSIDFVEDIPKNNYGKILKRELREKYWTGRDRKV